jgi:hypothetical protein
LLAVDVEQTQLAEKSELMRALRPSHRVTLLRPFLVDGLFRIALVIAR